MLNFSREQLEAVIQKYSTKKEMAAALKVSLPTLNRVLKEENLNKSTVLRYPEIDKEWLIEHWQNTDKSICTLAKEYNLPEHILENRITKYKLTKKYKHKLNLLKLFDETDPHTCYLAGLLATDGYFPRKHDMVTIELVGEDEYQLLVSLRQYYESSQPVKQYFHQERTFHTDGVHTNYWQISADGLQQFFRNRFGIVTENKTFNLNTPTNFYSEACAKAYIRGCLDGDGYISDTLPLVTLCTASEQFVLGVANIVKDYTGINFRYTTTPRSNNRQFPIVEWKTKRAKDLLDWVYSLDDCFKLERKYQRYLNYYQTKSKKDV